MRRKITFIISVIFFQIFYLLSHYTVQYLNLFFLLACLSALVVCYNLYQLLMQLFIGQKTEAELNLLKRNQALNAEHLQLVKQQENDLLKTQKQFSETLHTVQNMLRTGDCEKAETLIHDTLETFQRDRFHPYCEDNLILAILGSKRMLAEQSGIHVDYKIFLPEKSVIQPSDLSSVLFYGASGIGLLRSEFQYLGRENYPRENELFHAYKKLAETMGERTAVIRTADLGADKQASYLDIPAETNPIMGNRGIRLCLDRKKMFKAQLRAIYRASAYGNLAMMYPMIDSEEEMDQIEEIIREVKEGLDEKEIPYRNIRTGIMIETPAAVMISRELARRVNFLSIGTNDLTQYTLAMDRQNPLLKDKYNDHHPAVLRMIKMVVEAAHQENRQVGICGEIAADTELTETFLRMGVDFLSVVPACILPVRKAIREADLSSQ